MIHLLWDISLVLTGIGLHQAYRLLLTKFRFIKPQPFVAEKTSNLAKMIDRLLDENKRLNVEIALLRAQGDGDEEHY